MTKPEKYLFNQNVFDEPDEPDEELEPPAPSFSEDELEQARRDAYEQAYQKGRSEAAEEARVSREQFIAGVLQKISVDTGLLFAAEQEREQQFEEEVIRVSLAIFEKLFPVFIDSYGQEQFQSILKQILETQNAKSEIRIEVTPDIATGVENFLSSLKLENEAHKRIVVDKNTDIPAEACRLSWKDGGAIRNGADLAEDIKNILKNVLLDSQHGELNEKPHENSAKDAIVEEKEIESEPSVDAKADVNLKENLEKPDE